MEIFTREEFFYILFSSLLFGLSFSWSPYKFLEYFFAGLFTIFLKSIFLKFHGKKFGLWFRYNLPFPILIFSLFTAIVRLRVFLWGFFSIYFFKYERFKFRSKFPTAKEIGREFVLSSFLLFLLMLVSLICRIRSLFDASFFILISTLLPFKEFEGGKIFFYNYTYWASLLIISLLLYIFGW